MTSRWEFNQNADPEKVEGLSSAINVNPVLAEILVNRGIDTFDKARDFFRPSLDHLHDPYLMADMQAAVERINTAIDDKQKILIYGDYDVDGTTAVTLVYDFLSTLTDSIDYYIPDRYSEGYGVSDQSVAWASENGFSLVICLDCGITANQQVEEAGRLGIDYIICDHHQPGEHLPPASAILDPVRPDCGYPYKELTGCGVGFKLMQALAISRDLDSTRVHSYFDLLAVSIAADIVPITGENRVMAYYGLRKLNKDPRTGLKALREISGIRGQVDISGIVFGIAPRINASGRIDHARDAVTLLLAKDPDVAEEFAGKINKLNERRKDYDESITEEALGMISGDDMFANSKSTVLYKAEWHKGVIGIVASRCIESYYRPTIIMAKSNGEVTGSARSVHDFDIYDAISECSDLLIKFGGHKYAAGLTMKEENIDEFRDRFERVVSSRIRPDQETPVIHVESELPLEKATAKFYKIMNQMSPFGPGNPRPVFTSRQVFFQGKPQVLKEKHIKVILDQEGNGQKMEAMAFGMSEKWKSLSSGQKFDIAFQLDVNEYRGHRSLVLNIKDLKINGAES